MKAITRLDGYILLKYLKTFLLAMALIIVIVITFDVSEKLDDFLGNHAPLSAVVFDYYLNFIPEFVNMYSPLFIFISVIFFTSKMAGNTEIIAILGSGISYRRMLRPYMYGSILVALIVLAFGNFVIPVSNRTKVEFDSTYIHTRRQSYYSNIHLQPQQGVQVYAESYDANTMRANLFHRDEYDSDRHIRERVTCNSIVWDTAARMWTCVDFCRHVINGKTEKLQHVAMTQQSLGLTPEDFDKASQHIETMNSIELYRHIQRERMRGSNAVVEGLIELYQRLLNPLSIIVMTFIGVGVSSRKTRGGIGLSLAIGITLAFALIVFMKVSTVFAVNGSLPPFWAVLLPQAVFGLIAAQVIHTAPK